MENHEQAAVMLGPFGRVTVNLGRRAVVAHAHAEFNFLFKIAGADTAFRVAEGVCPLDAEHMIVLNPWRSHGKEEGTAGPTLILSLLIEPDWLTTNVAGFAQNAGPLFPQCSVCTTPAVRALAEQLVRSVTSFPPSAEGRSHDQLLELVGALSRAYAGDACSPLAIRPVDARIRRAAAYIQEHAADNPNLLTVASEVGLSRSHFFAQFKTSVGVSPQHYLDWARMRLAVRMLASDLPLAEVAAQLGFFAPSHFTRFFAQHVAIPPSEFRRSVVEQPAHRAAKRNQPVHVTT